MGCCGSKEERDDDVRAPLLDNDSVIERHASYQAIETIDVKKEQEFWDSVLERTTRNLIDISNTQADPLQNQDVQERLEKYRSLLERIAKTSAYNSSEEKIPASAVEEDPIDILGPIQPVSTLLSRRDLDEMMGQIGDALQEIRIAPVGDMVVHLKMLDDPHALQY
ncbi:hypothetical protein BX666DRAFT_1880429 [Dichotomocladium elegans]|nr:hypothetical protein BX666DRAFT_1880429 [Dichotomocladium elegans]